jgi:hypothetical protein
MQLTFAQVARIVTSLRLAADDAAKRAIICAGSDNPGVAGLAQEFAARAKECHALADMIEKTQTVEVKWQR